MQEEEDDDDDEAEDEEDEAEDEEDEAEDEDAEEDDEESWRIPLPAFCNRFKWYESYGDIFVETFSGIEKEQICVFFSCIFMLSFFK